MSPDLRLATVYVMPLGGKDLKPVLAALEQPQEDTSAARSRTRSTSSSRPTSASWPTRRSTKPTASSGCWPATRCARTSRRTEHHGTPQEGQGDPRLAGAGQAGRHDVDAGRRRRAPAVRCAQGRPRRHARPAGDGRAADRARRGDQDRALRRRRHQALPLHGALGRRHRHRRRRGRDHRHAASCAPRARPSRPCCRASPARSSRRRPPSPPSRSTATAPTTWRARARSSSWRRDPCRSNSLTLIDMPDRRHGRASRRAAARAPTCARSPATWGASSAASAT